jgi:hypothetical protein
MKTLFGFFVVPFLACMAFAAPSLAFAVAVTGGDGAAIVDIAPILTALVQMVATGLAAVIARFFHTGYLRDGLYKVLEMAVRYAIQTVHTVDWTKLETRNELVALAANYVIQSAPKALSKFGIDRPRLEQMVLARLHFHDPEPGRWDDVAAEASLAGEAERRADRGQDPLVSVPT